MIMGVPAQLDMVETTSPYYRSTYVFVSRDGRDCDLLAQETRAADLKIGVQLIGDNGFNTPPAHALGQQGISPILCGYTVYGDYRDASPRGSDCGGRRERAKSTWPPSGGRSPVILRARPAQVPLRPSRDARPRLPRLRFHFDIAIGVRKGDQPLKSKLDHVPERRRDDIRGCFESYGIPPFQCAASSDLQ